MPANRHAAACDETGHVVWSMRAANDRDAIAEPIRRADGLTLGGLRGVYRQGRSRLTISGHRFDPMAGIVGTRSMWTSLSERFHTRRLWVRRGRHDRRGPQSACPSW